MSDVKEQVEEKVEDTLDQPKVVFFGAGEAVETMLGLDKKGVALRLSPRDFPEIGEDVLSQFSSGFQREYYKTQGAREVMGLEKRVEASTSGTPYNLNAHLTYQYQDDEPGWHHTRIKAEDKEKYEQIGYKFVKIAHTKNGKPTMLEMKVNMENYVATLHRDARVSENQLKGISDTFQDKLREDKKFVRPIREEYIK